MNAERCRSGRTHAGAVPVGSVLRVESALATVLLGGALATGVLLGCSPADSGEGGPTLAESAGLGPSAGLFADDALDDAAQATPTGPLTAEQSCAASVVEAESIEVVTEVPVVEQVVVPSVYYLMLDSSGSMAQDLSGPLEQILDLLGVGQEPPTPPKWEFAIDGLRGFLGDPASAGIELGLRYFPGDGQCDGSGYDVPSVPLAPLPGNLAQIEASLAARTPAGGTPLEGALHGVTSYCLQLNAQRPDVSCVAVLITDGAADDECSAQSAAALAGIAADAFAQGVPTYVAGMGGADLAVLDTIGEAGGGDCTRDAAGFACDLTANATAFRDALSGIRDRTRSVTRSEPRVDRIVQVLPCEWEIPEPEAGARFDPARVNVEVSTSVGAQALGNVTLEANCGAEGGWYYDDASAPTRIRACPGTCEQLRARPEAKVDLLFGCATLVR